MQRVAISGLLLFVVQSITFANTITLNAAATDPLSKPDLTGFIDTIVSEAFQRIGIKLSTVSLPAERALKNSNAGVIDGELIRIKGMEKLYPNLLRVPEKIMDLEFVAFSNKNILIDNKWQSLSKLSVTFLNGWKIYEKNVPKSSQVTKVNRIKQLFFLLEKKRADLILYEKWGGLFFIKNNNLLKTKLLSSVLAKKEMFTYLHKKHSQLLPPFTTALKQMKKDGSYQAIKNRILSPLEKK